MPLPIVTSRDHAQLPGIPAKRLMSSSSSPTSKVIGSSLEVLLSFDRRFSAQPPSVTHLCAVGCVGSVVHAQPVQKGNSLPMIFPLRRVKLKEIELRDEVFYGDFDELPEVVNRDEEEAVQIEIAKAVFAETARQNLTKASDLTRQVHAQSDPALLAYLLLSSFGLVVEKKKGYRYFSALDEQQLLETDPATAKLRFIIDEYCQRVSLIREQCRYDESDPLWGKSPNDPSRGFAEIGHILSDGQLLIGCPSRLPNRSIYPEKDRCALAAASGPWLVFSGSSMLEDTEESPNPVRLIVLTRDKLREGWLEELLSAQESLVEVSSGCILIIAAMLADETELYRQVESASGSDVTVEAIELNGRNWPYVSISTHGDGTFPVRYVLDSGGKLKMAAVIFES